MKKLFYLFVLVGSLAFVGCSSVSNSGGDKFLGTWKEKGSNPSTTIITKGDGNTYDVLLPRNPKFKDSKEFSYKGFKYDPEKDILIRDKGAIMEIVYNVDSATIRPFVNHRPATEPQKKVE